uniref:Uncharacterized protein n=1 Tax=Schizaphis graminum TaxID=13262 RepID=A0A2S2PE50_SCHGA
MTTDRRERPCDARGGDGQAKSSSGRPSRSRSRSRRRRAYTVYRRVGRATAQRAPHTHTHTGIGYYGPPPVYAHKGRPQRASIIMRSCSHTDTPRQYVSQFHAKRRT